MLRLNNVIPRFYLFPNFTIIIVWISEKIFRNYLELSKKQNEHTFFYFGTRYSKYFYFQQRLVRRKTFTLIICPQQTVCKSDMGLSPTKLTVKLHNLTISSALQCTGNLQDLSYRWTRLAWRELNCSDYQHSFQPVFFVCI